MFTAEEYLEAKQLGQRHAGKPGSANTLKAYRHGIARAEQLIGKPLCEFTQEDGDQLLVLMEKAKFSAAHRANILASVRGAFAWAIGTKKFQGDDPLAGIGNPEVKRKIPTILTKEELTKLFDSFENERDRILFKLMYYGGLRISEAITLRRENVFSDAILVLGKGNNQRRTRLTDDVMQELKAFMKKTSGPYVFSAGLTPIHHTVFHDAFVVAKKKAQLPDALRPHNLRHTSATHMQRAVGNLAVTQRFLGHSRPETTAIYIQLADDDMNKAHLTTFGS